MIYGPAVSPSPLSPRDDGDEKPVRFPFHLIAVFRTVVFSLSLAGFILSVMLGREGAGPVFIDILLMLALLWNVLWVVKTIVREGSNGKLHLPQFMCAIGDFKLSCGGEHDYQRLLGDDGDDGDSPSPKKPVFNKHLGLLIDAFLAVTLLIVALAVKDDWYAYRYRAHESVFPLAFTVVALEFTVILLTPFRIFHRVTVFVRPEETATPDYQYRIHLPREPEAGRGAGKGVSVQSET
ncbi:hypothetical protein NKR23_g3104 [Pleurostoma richardsiae]|uniref:Uncharacterized protein n=1 Tax=Pleurostoma richardsiae TaxID=41990 RepID=A0AA38S0E6_9PEZI|nr:hypothetical protein NKR23_g3104 [Pleurostoma richardsiae]